MTDERKERRKEGRKEGKKEGNIYNMDTASPGKIFHLKTVEINKTKQ